jgi:hypothetical protein
MSQDSQIIKIHTLWKDKDEALRTRVEKLIFTLERMNEYTRNMKKSILSRTIDISVSIIEKIKKGKLNLPEKLLIEIINHLKDIFVFDKIVFFIHPEDERVLSLFFANLNIHFDQIIIRADMHLKRGECYCDYNFRTIKLGIIQKSIDIRNLLLDYFKEDSSGSLADNLTQVDQEDLSNQQKEVKGSVFELLSDIDDLVLVELLKNEEPKVIAAFLINLKPGKTAKILLGFDNNLRSSTMHELFSIGKISSTVIENIGKTVCSLISKDFLGSLKNETIVSS